MNDQLMAVIREVHSQHADDLCWMDIDRIFAAAGLPVPDRKVGDKSAMLRNCELFIGVMCQSGQWQSYAELEVELDRLKKLLGEAVAAVDRHATYEHGDHATTCPLDNCILIRCQDAVRLLARLREGVQV